MQKFLTFLYATRLEEVEHQIKKGRIAASGPTSDGEDDSYDDESDEESSSSFKSETQVSQGNKT